MGKPIAQLTVPEIMEIRKINEYGHALGLLQRMLGDFLQANHKVMQAKNDEWWKKVKTNYKLIDPPEGMFFAVNTFNGMLTMEMKNGQDEPTIIPGSGNNGTHGSENSGG